MYTIDKQKEAILAHQEGGVRRRDLCLVHKRRSIHQMDFEDELEKTNPRIGIHQRPPTKCHPRV